MSDAPAETSGAAMQVDAGLVRQLAELLDATRLTEIEVQDGDRRIRVARAISIAAAAPAPTIAVGAAATQPAAAPPTIAATAQPVLAAPAEHPGTVKSPMVGTAYLAPDPEAAPFAAIGSQVSAGDTLLIVEAMKVMNPITAPRAGRVSQVLISNGQPVEFDQPLIVVE